MSTNFNQFSDTLSEFDVQKVTEDLETAVAEFQDCNRKIELGRRHSWQGLLMILQFIIILKEQQINWMH